MLEPDVPDFAGRDGNIDRSLDALDQLDQVFYFLLAAIDGFIADHDTVDVAITLGQIDRRQYLAFVAFGVLVDPGADGDFEADLIGDRRHQFAAFRRSVQANRSRQGGELPEIGANPVGVGNAVGYDVTPFEGCVGSTLQNALEVWGLLLI